MRTQLCYMVATSVIVAIAAAGAAGQTVILDDDFDGSGIDTSIWSVVVPEPGIDVVETVEGTKLHVLSSGGGSRWTGAAGIWTRPDTFPLITRPTDDTEYNVYFSGIELPAAKQRFAVGLYSTNPPTHTTPKFPDDNGPNGGTSYYFMSFPNNDAPADNWLSTFSISVGGAAADSTGADGFHTWEFGKVYDLRLQITKDDVNWWGRERPYENWKLLQDPSAVIMGHYGGEPNGRSTFGLFVHVSASGVDGVAWQDGDIRIDRITVTKYKSSPPEIILDDGFDGSSLDTAVWDAQVPQPYLGDKVEVTNGKLHVVNRGGGMYWSGGVGIISEASGFPLFTRPSDPEEKIWVDFLGVQSPAAKQRFAIGLHGINPPGNPTPKLPDDDGMNGGLAYLFWVLPDNDYLPEDSNHVRAKVINDHYAATDNYHHAWLWMYPEVRDFRIEVTSSETNWYIRKDLATGWRVVRDATEDWVPRPLTVDDAADGYWRPVYDPGVRTEEPYDGTEPHGRNLFGVFVHGSSGDASASPPYEDADFTIDRIRVRRVHHIVVVSGDMDEDGDVDLADYGSFLSCYNGPGNPPGQAGCEAADFDEDGDVDLTDYGVFLGCYNGPNKPPACL
jgi:hypothetical protein